MPWGTLDKITFFNRTKKMSSQSCHISTWMPSTVTVYGFQKVWVRFNLLFIIKIPTSNRQTICFVSTTCNQIPRNYEG